MIHPYIYTASVIGVVIKEDEKDEGCMIHLDTYSELQAYFGPLRYYQLSQSIAYIGPDMITEKHGCMYGMTRSGYEMNCHCDASRRRDCAVFHEADDIICAQRDKLDDIGPALSFDLSNLRSAKNCIFWVYGRMQIVDGRSKLSFMTALRPDTNNACNNVYAKMKENMKCIVKDMVADSSLCPFQSDQSRPEIHYAEMGLINLGLKKMHVTFCSYNHIYHLVFQYDIYGPQCIIHFDFKTMRRVNLIHGSNMEFAEDISAKELYGSERMMELVDVIIDTQASNCTTFNDIRDSLLKSKLKAWTVAILKCTNVGMSIRCDDNVVKELEENATHEAFSDDHGTICFVGNREDGIKLKGSLITRWCLERVIGFGPGYIHERGFLTEESFDTMKNLPHSFQCRKADRNPIVFRRNKIYRNCYTRFDKLTEQPETICCCISKDRRIACNNVALDVHIRRNAVTYGSGVDKVCQTSEALKTLRANEIIDLFSEEHLARVYCCYEQFNCFDVIGQIEMYVRHFSEPRKSKKKTQRIGAL
ncbi:unnamed protein product [Toxocara canis]|uniref:ATP-dependent DNA helicase n=1 Tax=Toxocara canis TaxID=6265 RepID=A0A183UTN2_TOXCA|nr:unnamed protein product [Toxocara canis]